MKNIAERVPMELQLEMFGVMLRIRGFELKTAECFAKGMLAGNIHTCIGQEAVSAGACTALQQGDFITGTHRGHGQCIAKGARTDRMLAELFGKKTGYCAGKSGSMHVADVGLGILGANGIVGAGLPIAAGSALASKIRHTPEVTLAFFGDGASNNGTFHETVNIAAAWKLPMVFLCENNGYAVSVNIHSVTNTEDIAARAAGYGIPGMVVDGNDAVAVYNAVHSAAERARGGGGPSIVECKTYRIHGHYEGDPAAYRTKEETKQWKAKDPIERLRAELLAQGAAPEKLEETEAAIAAEIEEAYRFAVDSAYPDPAEVREDVYFADNERSVAR